MRRPTRRDVGLALLFGVPPGVGVLGFSTALAFGETTLLGVLAGVLTAAVIGGFVLLIAVTGSPDDGE